MRISDWSSDVCSSDLVALGGLGLVRAIGNTKFLNLATNIAGLLALIVGGHVLWLLGLSMAAANVAGNQLGARLAIRFGGRGVRALLVVLSSALAPQLDSEAERVGNRFCRKCGSRLL